MPFSIIESTIPGSPAPDPISVHILLFMSIKSMTCAQSIICLFFKLLIVFELIKLISLFFSIISSLNSSNSENVSRGTLNLSRIR
ncbi:uncharacterized protein METZ01_LOCUS164318 [marine metagenome]|uniref:Uncharacterized protein n=1 Tax=marine metagenome TaxID=408172 RepID=A0A382BCT9_9ZZZZ